MVRSFARWLLAVALVAVARPAVAQSGFTIIVNAANPAEELAADQVSALFLKRATRWDGGALVVPVDLPERSAVRERFSQVVHGRTSAAVAAYWQTQVFSGRAVPPAVRDGGAEVVAFVAENAGAIGYVPAGTLLPAGVRALRIGSGDTAGGPVVEESALDERPVLVSQPAPSYPPRLRPRRAEGTVILQFTVRPDGRVDPSSVRIVASAEDAFNAPAVESVRRSVYRPGRSGGRAVAVRVQQQVRFAFDAGGS